MKPDKTVCLYCNTQIARGKYCSDAHRMAYKREHKGEQTTPPNPNKPEQIKPEHEAEQKNEQREQLTKTDKTFYDRAIKDFGEPYYNFSNELREVTCDRCRKKFKTGLSLNRYCSYTHYSETITGVKRPEDA